MRRPLSFFGPDDYYLGMNVQREQERVAAEQAAWDKLFAAQPWWRRILGLDPR